ncbi:hypothetical protein D3C85_1114050 [compost metagenome]
MFTLRFSGGRLVAFCPLIFSVPDVGSSNPAMIRIRVVLPQPLGPSSVRISPFWISRLMLFKALNGPNALWTLFSCTIDLVICFNPQIRSSGRDCGAALQPKNGSSNGDDNQRKPKGYHGCGVDGWVNGATHHRPNHHGER